jgi:hypothetical protein
MQQTLGIDPTQNVVAVVEEGAKTLFLFPHLLFQPLLFGDI